MLSVYATSAGNLKLVLITFFTLVACLLTSHQLLHPQATTANDHIRILMLMVIAIVVAELSQRITSIHKLGLFLSVVVIPREGSYSHE